MSFGFTIDIGGNAAGTFARVIANLRRPDLRRVMGRAIAGHLRRHFTRLDRERPNKLGGTRTHFWGQVRRSVQQPELIGGDGIKIAINHVGAAQRYFGGDIEPKNAGALTLPVHPEAYGRRAREFELDAIYFGPGVGVLVDRSNPDSKGDIGEVFYRLVQHVHQEPDPTVLPPEDELETVALQAGKEYLDGLAGGHA